MIGQMNIFDYMTEDKPFNPIEAVAERARPYWTKSIETLTELLKTHPEFPEFVKAVKKEYCPYGLNGSYGIDGKPGSLFSFDILPAEIRVTYVDDNGERVDAKYTWSDFAEEIAKMITRGESDE